MEVDERVRLAPKTADEGDKDDYPTEKGVTGEFVEIIKEPDIEKLKADLKVMLPHYSFLSSLPVLASSFFS